MTRGRWLEVDLRPTGAWESMSGEDVAAACVAALSPLGVLGAQERPDGGVTAWLPATTAREAVVSALLEGRVGCAVASCAIVEDGDWVEQWNASLQPIDVGNRLTILPRPGEAPAGRIALIIEPGRAFGTGHHESTRLALAGLDGALQAGDRVLDVGTGSGILALAAARLGASRVVAVDIDEEAVEVARANLDAQEGGERVSLSVGSDPARIAGEFEVVVANIQADVILTMLDGLAARLAPAGTLVLSGILAGDESTIDVALSAHGITATWTHEGEWACASGRASR
jgi:ribosomal protein L11 methyltransferase